MLFPEAPGPDPWSSALGGATCVRQRDSGDWPAMPSRAEDYEVLYTIGTGSYGRCQKIRRKSDGKVSVGPSLCPPLLRGDRPAPPKGTERAGEVGARKTQPSL